MSGLIKNDLYKLLTGFPGGSLVKNPSPNAGDVGSVPESGRFLGGGNGNRLQYSWLENSMDRGAWWFIAHGVAESWTLEATEHVCKLPTGTCHIVSAHKQR